MNTEIKSRMSHATNEFLASAHAVMAADLRFCGLLAAGSAIDGSMDVFSDLDLIVVCADSAYRCVLDTRRQIAESLGNLHAAFTGEHVGEPRLLICLYGDPLLHVDLKFVKVDDLDRRIETPLLIWSRDSSLAERVRLGSSAWPNLPPEWFEERFWVWVHYGAAKIGRGELFEAISMLNFLRDQVLGPLVARTSGRDQRGVRRVEYYAPELAKRLQETLCSDTANDAKRAYFAAIALYRELRADAPPDNVRWPREEAVCQYLAVL